MTELATIYLEQERGRLQQALRQLAGSDEQLQAQANANAEQRAELNRRLVDIAAALAPPEDAAAAG